MRLDGSRSIVCRSVEWALLALAVGAAAVIAAGTIHFVIQSYVNLFITDQWDEPLARDVVRNLLTQHNEHRLVIPRLLFLIDFEFFAASDKFNLAMTLVVQAVHVAVLVYAAHCSGLTGTRAKIWIAAIATALMFAINQYENFSNGFQVQFVLVFFFSTASLVALSRHAETRRPVWLAASLILMLCGIGTMANGLLLPIIWIAAAVWMRLSRVAIIAGAALGLIAIGLYLVGYTRPSGHADPLASLRMIHRIARYIIDYLGGPVGQSILPNANAGTPDFSTRLWLAFVSGTVIVVIVAALAIAMLRGRTNTMQVALLSTALFVVGTAALTALGRANFSIDQALSSRYGAGFAALASALAILLMTRWPPRLAGRWPGIVFGAVGACVLVLLATAQREELLGAGLRTDAWRNAQTALLANVKDAETLLTIFPNADYVWQMAHVQKDARVSFGAEPWAGWLGKPLPPEVRIEDRSECRGGALATRAVAAGAPDDGGWAIGGWITADTAAKFGDRLVVIGPDRTVIGYARVALWSWVPGDDPYSASHRRPWRGYVKVAPSPAETVVLLSSDLSSGCVVAQGLQAAAGRLDRVSAYRSRKALTIWSWNGRTT